MSFNNENNYNSYDDPNNLNDYDISQISGVDRDDLERLLDSDEVFEPQVSNSPTAINKLLVVGGGVGIIVFLAFLLFGGFSPSKVAESNDTEEQTTTEITEQQNDEEMARLRAELALKDQKLNQTSDLTIKKPEKEVEDEVKTEPKPQPQRQVQQKTQPKPRPQPQTTVQRQPQRQTKPQRRVQRRQSPKKQEKIDSQKRWDELADIGSYKAKEGTGNNQGNNNNQQRQQIAFNNNQPSTTNNPRNTLQRQRVAPVVNRSQSITQVDSDSIPRQNVAGVIKGGLAVPANSRSNSQLKVPIVISEPIKDNNGTILIESGATIVSDISIDGSIVNFSPQTISFEKGGQYYELALDDSIIITGEQGPVIASLQTLGEKNGLSIDQIGQLAGLSGVLGDDAKDLSVAISIFNNNNSSRRRSRNQIVQLYTIPQNTAVKVRVVRNIPFQMGDTEVNTTSIKFRTESDFETTGLSFDEPDENYVQEDEMLTDDGGVITGDTGVITGDGYSNDNDIIVGNEYLDQDVENDQEYLEDEYLDDEYLTDDDENLIAEEVIEDE